MNDSDIRGIGDNRPPSPIEAIQIGLRERFPTLLTRKAELLEAQAKAPAEVNDEETARNTSDRVRQLSTCIATIKETHKLEKQPHLDGGRAVDGFFGVMEADLDDAKRKENAKLLAYADRKADEERRRREAEAARLREEEQRAQREAAERAAAIETPEDLQKALVAEDQAQVASVHAAQAQRAAEVKPAQLSQVRGNLGSVSSMTSRWTGDVVDKAALDLNALRPYMTVDDLNKAVRAFVKAGGRKLAGSRIYEARSMVGRG